MEYFITDVLTFLPARWLHGIYCHCFDIRVEEGIVCNALLDTPVPSAVEFWVDRPAATGDASSVSFTVSKSLAMQFRGKVSHSDASILIDTGSMPSALLRILPVELGCTSSLE